MRHYCRKKNQESILLCESSAPIGADTVEYQLYVFQGRGTGKYLLRLTLGKEQRQIGLGRDIKKALQFYQKLVRGRVTPCSLYEIFEDFCEEYR